MHQPAYNGAMSTKTNAQPISQLDWQDGLPRSRQFGDVYFSRDSGVQESRHVFLQHNHLAERFAAMRAGEFFTIAETGFGTGLNFLCAWQLWQQVAPAGARLHFVSLEKYPLSALELQQALALWPELAPWAAQLLAQYQALTDGWHRFIFTQGAVSLTLVVGDASETLPQVVAEIDAWFLDGFAPSKNPQLWSIEVLQQVARLTRSGGTFATYTCAGEVRHTLEHVGFSVEKVRGHGIKREMLRGMRLESIACIPSAAQHCWRLSVANAALGSLEKRTAIIVGAGLAGASLAHALAVRGWQVTVVDRHAQPASEASGNPVGVLYPRLTDKNSPVAQLIRQGYQHSVRLLHATDTAATDWHPCGVLQLALDAEEQERFALCSQRHDFAALGEIVDVPRARQLTGIAVEHGGLWLPQGGWVSPPRWCQHWLKHENIRFIGNFDAHQLQPLPDGAWQVSGHLDEGEQVQLRANVLVMCTASQAQWCEAIAYLPMRALRGQVSQVAATPASEALTAVLCGEGYVAPAHGGRHLFGASFDRSRLDRTPSLVEHVQNMQILQKLAPALATALGAQLDPEKLQGYVALRATSPDFLPILGSVRSHANHLARFQNAILPNFYVSLAHGARGLISAPLMAETLASQINGEPAPIGAEVMMAVRATRFHKRM